MPHYILPTQWQTVHNQKIKFSGAFASWLLDSGSLTQRLRQHCNKFTVQVLQQKWQQPRYDEKKILAMSTRENVFVREVWLSCDDKVCVFAHSVFPKKTLRGEGWRLRHLQTKPLIEILATDALLSRSEFTLTCLQPSDIFYQRLTKLANSFPKVLWQRRSLFHFHKQPLLVCETFFPAILELKEKVLHHGLEESKLSSRANARDLVDEIISMEAMS